MVFTLGQVGLQPTGQHETAGFREQLLKYFEHRVRSKLNKTSLNSATNNISSLMIGLVISFSRKSLIFQLDLTWAYNKHNLNGIENVRNR